MIAGIDKVFIGQNPISFVYKGNIPVYQRLHPKTRILLEYARDNSIPVPEDITPWDLIYKEGEAELDLMDLYYQFAGNADPAFKLINMVNPGVYNGTGFGGLGWSNSGVLGNGTNAYIDTNFNPSLLVSGQKYQLNDAGRGAVVCEPYTGTLTNNSAIDSTGAVNNALLNDRSTGHRINSQNMPENININNTLGLKTINRYSENDVMLTRQEVEFNTISPSTIIADVTQMLLRRSTNDGFFSTLGISNYFMGASLTYEQTQNMRTWSNNFFRRTGLPEIA